MINALSVMTHLITITTLSGRYLCYSDFIEKLNNLHNRHKLSCILFIKSPGRHY